MITTINIKNFKIHKNTSVQTRNLTILTGVNGMGKSSIIQSLLLLRQSNINNIELSYLNLKGDLCDIGTAGDLECQTSDTGYFDVELQHDEIRSRFCFEYPKGSNGYYDTELIKTDGIASNSIGNCPIFGVNFQYISAFRAGPQKYYERDTNVVRTNQQISKIMGKCEYTVHFLEENKNKEIPIKELCSIDTTNNDYRLGNQIDLWMKLISPNIAVTIEQSNESFRLNYKFSRENDLGTGSISSLNTGFGITYVLPILVAILSARKGAIIIIENPEAHIHPKGQAVLMGLVSRAAANGVQIIIETHSDHIVNGALVSVVEGILSPDTLSMHFFERNEHEHIAVVHNLHISASGKVKNPPKGFFDQLDIDLEKIMGF